jgi:hypothetical protein
VSTHLGMIRQYCSTSAPKNPTMGPQMMQTKLSNLSMTESQVFFFLFFLLAVAQVMPPRHCYCFRNFRCLHFRMCWRRKFWKR